MTAGGCLTSTASKVEQPIAECHLALPHSLVAGLFVVMGHLPRIRCQVHRSLYESCRERTDGMLSEQAAGWIRAAKSAEFLRPAAAEHVWGDAKSFFYKGLKAF